MDSSHDVRDNFKTIRLSDAEYALIQRAASCTETANPSEVIRDGAIARAEEILEAEPIQKIERQMKVSAPARSRSSDAQRPEGNPEKRHAARVVRKALGRAERALNEGD